MDIEILEREANPMLHRSDVRFQIVHEDASPSRLSVRDSLAAALNRDSDEVVVHKLDTKYGMRKTVGYAKVYDTPGHAVDVEQEYMLERNRIAADGEGERADAADASDRADAADASDRADAADTSDRADAADQAVETDVADAEPSERTGDETAEGETAEGETAEEH